MAASEVDGDKSAMRQGEFSLEEMERIRRLDVQNIRLKAEEGAVLTREQLKRLELAMDEGDPADSFVETQDKLADALGVADRKSIQRWLKEEGCPGKNADGRYNVKDWKLWVERKGKRTGSKAPNLEKQREKSMALDVRLKELELDERMGRMISREECLEVLMPLMTRITQQFRQMKHSLAPKVVGETVPEAGKRIGAEVDTVLEGLSAIPEEVKKKAFWRSVSTVLCDHLQTCLLGDTPMSTSRSTTAMRGTPI